MTLLRMIRQYHEAKALKHLFSTIIIVDWDGSASEWALYLNRGNGGDSNRERWNAEVTGGIDGLEPNKQEEFIEGRGLMEFLLFVEDDESCELQQINIATRFWQLICTRSSFKWSQRGCAARQSCFWRAHFLSCWYKCNLMSLPRRRSHRLFKNDDDAILTCLDENASWSLSPLSKVMCESLSDSRCSPCERVWRLR